METAEGVKGGKGIGEILRAGVLGSEAVSCLTGVVGVDLYGDCLSFLSLASSPVSAEC